MNDSPTTTELVTLVQRLCRALRRADPGHNLATTALGYLKRHGLKGSPLRADDPKMHEIAEAVQGAAKASGVTVAEARAAAEAIPPAPPGMLEAIALAVEDSASVWEGFAKLDAKVAYDAMWRWIQTNEVQQGENE